MLMRNQRCLCGSGKRFKHCHGALSADQPDAPIQNWHSIPQRVRDSFNKKQKGRLQHFQNFGLHRPTLMAGGKRDQFIIRGSQIIHWDGGGTFLNFLEADLLREMGEEFSHNSTHPINVWREAMRTQARLRDGDGIKGKIISTVAALNFFTVAYDLFLIADNTKCRERLLKSLRKSSQFHGARYELMIAACLVRAGFSVEFSDEDDSTDKHSDAAARHLRTGQIYSIEMKAKGRSGILGKIGTPPSASEMKRDVSRLIRRALEKPADNNRLIFIDMNLPPPTFKWADNGVWWQRDAVEAIHAIEAQPGNVAADTTALIIFTNLPSYQMAMDEYYTGLEVAFTGIRKPPFKQEHTYLDDHYSEIANLFEAFNMHDMIPESFM